MTKKIKQIIAEMREKEKQCSDLPWRETLNTLEPAHRTIFEANGMDVADIRPWCNSCEPDAAFIVYARNNITAILDYVERLEKEVAELEDWKENHDCDWDGIGG